MKVLTLTQPWATLVAIGAKHVETRSWGTSYRGPLAIHAAKGYSDEDQDMIRMEPFNTVLRAARYYKWSDLPRGKILAICELTNVLKITGPIMLGPNERAFGNFERGRYAWHLRGARPLAPPVEATGKLGLWTFDLDRALSGAP